MRIFFSRGKSFFCATIIELLIHAHTDCTWRPFVHFPQCRHYLLCLVSSESSILIVHFNYVNFLQTAQFCKGI